MAIFTGLLWSARSPADSTIPFRVAGFILESTLSLLMRMRGITTPNSKKGTVGSAQQCVFSPTNQIPFLSWQWLPSSFPQGSTAQSLASPAKSMIIELLCSKNQAFAVWISPCLSVKNPSSKDSKHIGDHCSMDACAAHLVRQEEWRSSEDIRHFRMRCIPRINTHWSHYRASCLWKNDRTCALWALSASYFTGCIELSMLWFLDAGDWYLKTEDYAWVASVKVKSWTEKRQIDWKGGTRFPLQWGRKPLWQRLSPLSSAWGRRHEGCFWVRSWASKCAWWHFERDEYLQRGLLHSWILISIPVLWFLTVLALRERARCSRGQRLHQGCW